MPIRSLLLTLSLTFVSMACATAANGDSAERDAQIEQWLDKLTLEEKVGQLNLVPIEGAITDEQREQIRAGKIGSVLKSNGVERNRALQKIAVEESRAGVPILFQEDVIHGYRTIAPVPLAEAASWDMEAIRRSAAVAAREASAAGIHLTYAPMVDICRDPRWGRIIEAAGEDPYLGSLVAEARVRGFQDDGADKGEHLLATVKHFVGYGAALAGRDYNIIDISERELREAHLPPFQAAVDAGVSSVMSAYTIYDGVPVTASSFIMRDVLRGEMGFEGLLMTDWTTIENLVKTGVAADKDEAVLQAIEARIDMDMTSGLYVERLPELVRQGRVDEAVIDEAVRKVLRLKQQVGLLDDPYGRFDEEREKNELLSEQNWQETLDIALKSMVLLKNDKDTLPIGEEVKSIAMIGPLAKSAADLLGWWDAMGKESEVVTIFDGLEQQFGEQAKLDYAEGVKIDEFKEAGAELIDDAVELAESADLVIAVVGEQEWMSGEGGGVASLTLPGLQEELLEALDNTGVNIVTVVVTGRPYVLTNVAKHSDAVLQAWMPGSTGGEAVAKILAGEFNPVGRLPVSFPYHLGQVPIYHAYKATSHSFDKGEDKANERYTTTHRDVQSGPLYPFGYGLGYTEFSYGEIELGSETMQRGSSLVARVEITNTGKRTGRETVQLYIRDKVAEVALPLKELRDFALVELEPGASEWVEFEITEEKLAYIGRNLEPRVDAGEFIVYIGRNAEDLQAATFVLQ